MVRLVVPVRGFHSGFERLREFVDDETRWRIARHLATQVITSAVASAAADPVVVTSDGEVAAHATALGARIVAEGEARGLDAAAATGIEGAASWIVVHADLPFVQTADLEAAIESVDGGRPVVAPSHDGGTSLVGARGAFAFSFGQGSFRRHLALLPQAKILLRRGLLLDVDTGDDVTRLLDVPGFETLNRPPASAPVTRTRPH